VGNSITRGDAAHEPAGSANQPTKSATRMRDRGNYPQLLNDMGQGRIHTVNFGHGGRTVVNATNAYVRTDEYAAALVSRPHVVVLMLGTNDCKRTVWGQYRQDFGPALANIGRSFLALPSQPSLLLLVPPPIVQLEGQSAPVNDFQPKVLSGEVRERIQQVGRQLSAESAPAGSGTTPCAPGAVTLLDLHERWTARFGCVAPPGMASTSCASLYSRASKDGVHTSVRGAEAIAAAVYEVLEGCRPRDTPQSKPRRARSARW